MEDLAKELGITCITRKIPGGFKAGNINNAVRETNSEFIAVFDADHIPHADFLKKMMGYFVDPKMGFVQSPQYYKNYELNYVTEGAWQQQELFFGVICKGKNRLNSVFMCGTNMVLRRTTLIEAGGMCEHNIAEDFLTSLFVHQNGWKSTYVPEVLAEGLAPEDFLSYYKQQFRWTRGSLEVIFKFNPLFTRKLTWAQKIQYLGSAGYYLSGLIVFINLIFPLTFFFFGLIPIKLSTMTLAMVFLPYIISSLYVLQASSNFSYTFKALSFSVSSAFLQLQAIYTVLRNTKTSFAVTSKKMVEGNFLYLVRPHLFYIVLVIIGALIAFARSGINASFVTNLTWAAVNITLFLPFIYAAMPKYNIKPKLHTKLSMLKNYAKN
jgi:cellulose synthase (UDP-forming)